MHKVSLIHRKNNDNSYTKIHSKFANKRIDTLKWIGIVHILYSIQFRTIVFPKNPFFVIRSFVKIARTKLSHLIRIKSVTNSQWNQVWCYWKSDNCERADICKVLYDAFHRQAFHLKLSIRGKFYLKSCILINACSIY